MDLNRQFELIRQSPTIAITDRITLLKAAGRSILPLHVGDPDFDTPRPILEAAFESMNSGMTHYVPSRGLPELRQAVAEKLQRDNAASYDLDTEVLVTHGSIHAYYLAMQSILNPGDDVLVPDPTWATHANMAVMLRGNVIRVPAFAEDGFIPKLEAWENTLTPKTRLIVINYPSNPTGAYPDRAYLQRLHEFAAAHDLWVVSDEVYENLYYGEKPVCAAGFQGAKERTILVNSLSKTYAMTGWRVGYLAAPKRVIDNALKAGQNSITCVAPFVQKAAAFALSDPSMQQAAAEMRAVYARRRRIVLDVTRKAGDSPVTVRPAMGAFYFFLDFRALNRPSLEICERLLEEAGVGLIPGSAFGRQGEGFVRMTIAASNRDVATGMKSILEWAEKVAG
jgi:aspartate/methionine/tyrosine aminotransferase